MNPIQTLSLALGAGFSSGLNLYATVATLGLLQRLGIVHLPASLEVLAHPWVIGVAAGLYLVEFFADKIPYFDTIWDFNSHVHTATGCGAAGLRGRGRRWSGVALGSGAACGRRGADFARHESERAGSRQYQPGAIQQLDVKCGRGCAGGLAVLDGQRSSRCHSYSRFAVVTVVCERSHVRSRLADTPTTHL